MSEFKALKFNAQRLMNCKKHYHVVRKVKRLSGNYDDAADSEAGNGKKSETKIK